MGRGRFSNLEVGSGAHAPVAPPPAKRPRRGAKYLFEKARRRELAGRLDRAAHYSNAAPTENPRLFPAWRGLAWALLDTGRADKARDFGEKADTVFPDHPEARALSALARWRLGQSDLARRQMDLAVATGRYSDTVWLARGEMMQAESDEAADDCFVQARQHTRDPGWTELRIGLACQAAGRHEPAAAAFLEATLALPKAARAWRGLGMAQRALGHADAAQRALAEAERLAPAAPKSAKPPPAAPERVGLLARLRRRFFG